MPAVVAMAVFAGCGSTPSPDRALTDIPAPRRDDGPVDGRLPPLQRWRPGGALAAPGLHTVRMRNGRRALLRVPRPVRGGPLPLVVVLHGAGGSARSGLQVLARAVGDARVALLAPRAHDRTWDVVAGGFGADVVAIGALLERVSVDLRIDRSRFAIAGYSDGASYALSLGLTNGDRLSHVVAFSPGFAAPATRRGRPPILISHGTGDEILPIDRTSRRVVPALRRAGYRVRYREFAGGHGIPRDIARDALRWVLAGR